MDTSNAQDFDFLLGRWHVAHRRLRERLCGCTQWQSFAGTCTVQPQLGGAANVDDNLIELPEGAYRAISLRVFDAGARRWAIWWLDGRRPHALDVPVVGGFAGVAAGKTGRFEAQDRLDGRSIVLRFEWTEIDTPSPLWSQAFSADAGRTWEVNWTMRFTRAPRD